MKKPIFIISVCIGCIYYLKEIGEDGEMYFSERIKNALTFDSLEDAEEAAADLEDYKIYML